jgi:hypothetical protein
MADQHSTLRARRRAQTQQLIQGHAVRLFAERGYDATTVNDVAEAAGVSPMTVYRSSPSASSPRRPRTCRWSTASAARSSARPRR